MSPPTGEARIDLLLSHARWVQGLARSLIGDAARAEDAVQDTWVAALSARPTADRSLRPWLRRVLVNFARKSFLRRAREVTCDAAPLDGLPDPQELCEELELERLMTAELARLREPYRSTLLLRYYRDTPPSEIARQQGVPAGTVRWRLKRGLELLRERLDDDAGGRRSWCALLAPLARSGDRAASAAAGSALPLTGVLVMNATTKTLAAAAAVLVALIGLAIGVGWGGLLPSAAATGDPVQVSFRPLPPSPEPDQELRAPTPAPAPEARQARAVASDELGPEATAPPDTLAVVEATVVDERGNPIAGALLREVTREGPRPGAAGAADGFVRLELEPGPKGRGVCLEATAVGLASQAVRLRLQPGRTHPLGRLALAPGGVISGRVLDEEGRGVAGALVTWGEVNARRQELEIRRFLAYEERQVDELEVPVTRTDVHGGFALAGLPGGYARLWAQAPGKLPSYTEGVEVRAGQESFGAEIVLRDIAGENRVEGVVVDPQGAPVPFASLEYFHRSKDLGLGFGAARDAAVDGTFSLVLADDARLTITARDPQGRWGPAEARDVRTGGPDLVLQLADGPRAQLTVIGAEGEIVERFRFEVRSPGDEPVVHTRGEWRQGAEPASFLVPQRPFIVEVTAPLHRVAQLGPLEPDAAGAELELRLESAPGLRGVVRGADGPLSGARVTLHAPVPAERRLERNGFRCWMDPTALDAVETDAEGRFLLTVRAAGDFVVRAEREGFAPADEGPLPLSADLQGRPVELRLGPGGALEGRVIPPRGEDPTGTVVGLHRGDGHGRTTRVGAEGTYRFEGLTPGPWRLERLDEEPPYDYTATSPSQRSFEGEVQWNCEVLEGTTTSQDLVLSDPDALRLRGTVAIGGVAPETLVTWLCPPDADYFDNLGRWPTSTPDPEGRFSLGVPEPGRYRLVLKHTAAGGEWLFLAEVLLEQTETTWSMECATGSVAIEGVDATFLEEYIPPFVYTSERPDGVRFLGLPSPGEDGLGRLPAVPVGIGHLVRPTMESMDPEDWAVALEVEVREGEETRIVALR